MMRCDATLILFYYGYDEVNRIAIDYNIFSDAELAIVI